MATVGELELVVRVAGEQQAVSSLRQLKAAEDAAADSARKLAQASERTSGGLRSLLRPTDEAKAKGRQLGQVFNQLTETAFGFTATLGRTNPQLFQLGINLAGAGNSAYQMGAAFGPLGVALGATIGLLPSLVQWLTSTGDELDTVAEKAAKARDKVLSFEQALAEVRAGRAALERQRRLREGKATSLEVEAEIRLAQRQEQQRFERLQKLFENVYRRDATIRQLARRAMTDYEGTVRQIREMQRLGGIREGITPEQVAAELTGLALAQQRQRELQPVLQQATAREQQEALRKEAERQRRERERAARMRRRMRAAARTGRGVAAREPTLDELMQRALQPRRDAFMAFIEQQAAMADRAREAEERAEEEHQRRLAELERQGIEERQRIYERRLEDMQKLNERYVEAAATAGEALAQAFVSGESIPEAMAKVVADAVSKEARIQAAKEVAAAASSFAVGNVGGGAAHTAAAVAWAAVPPLASALFGGAGGAAPAPTSGRGASALPRADAPPGVSDGGGRQVVVNINAPVPEALLGRDMDRARREARRRFGR